MPRPEGLCPGKEQRIKGTKDLEPALFRRLVARRARRLVDPSLAPVETEKKRRALERDIEQFFEKIHKGAEFLPARFLSDGAARARAVCRISTPTSLGTGFLIAPGAVMTNNHVLPVASEAGDSLAEFALEDGGAAKVVAVQPERLFLTDETLDFTIVACDEAGLNGIEPIPLLRNPATVTRHERVNVIQHPRGRPKEVALHDNRVTRLQDKVVHYRTDTEPGSSGSPVFNNRWELVALHHAGWREDGEAATNEGVRISAIVAHLLARTRTEAGTNRAGLEKVLAHVPDTSPYLGFFDAVGVEDPDRLEIEVPDFTGTPDFADIGVWNIEHFNDQVSAQRVEAVADVVARLAMDVLGLVEVQQGALDRLVMALGARGFAMGYELLNVRGSQDLAVLYDRDTTTVALRNDLATRHKSRLNKRTATGKRAFPRPPVLAECTVAADGGQDIRFLLILVHLKAFGDAQSRARRRLAAQMLAEMINDIRDREGLPVVLGGDFNERLDTDVLSAVTRSPDLFAMTADDATTDAISYVGASHRSLIDHILVSRDVVLGEISGDDAAIVRLDRSVRDFADRVSDHVPVVFRMVLRPEAVDLEPGEPAAAVIAIPEGATRVRVNFSGAN